MKILFVLEYYYPHIGGVEVFFQHLAEGLAVNGFDVTVVTSKVKYSEKEEIFNKVKIKRLSIPKIGQRYWFTFLSFFYLFFKVKKYEIVHTTTYNAALPAWLASFFWNKKVVITVHEVLGKLWFRLPEMSFFIALLHYIFEWFILRLPFDRYIGVSNYTKNALLKFHPTEKVDKIYHGIDYQLFNAAGYNNQEIRKKLRLENNFIYTYFGRPGWIKGITFLIQAVPKIKKTIPQSRLLLLLAQEPAKPYQAIKKLIKDLKINREVILLNQVTRTELPKYILSSDCVIVPSLSEGFGFTAAETSALDIPLVVTAVGSLPEVVSGRVVFCQPQDSTSLAEGVINIYHNKFKILKKKSFSWEDAINQYIDLYKKI